MKKATKNMEEKIRDNLKEALRNKNEIVVSVLRMLISAIQNKEISLRKEGNAKLNNKQIIEVIKSEVKQRKDSIEAYEKGNRHDLADKEKKELLILEKYLPEQMSDKDLKNIINNVINSIEDVGMKDFGNIMKQVMKETKGRADGKKASEIVKSILVE